MRVATPLPLGTKASLPTLAPPIIARPRLDALLADGTRRPVTLVSAAPGAGKTTLVANWLAARSATRNVWLTLDARDNQPWRVTRLVLEALARGGLIPERIARSVHPDSTRLDAAFEELGRRGAHVILALDDLQELTGREPMATVAHLVEHAPPCLELVLVTRADPPLSLGRLRLAGRISEIRGVDLAFNLDEAAELFAAHGLSLGPNEIHGLWHRTEGWAAGLRLAAFTLQDGVDASEFVQAVTSADTAISDYLLRELLMRQGQDVQDFLLRTSVVERFTPELATVLTDDPDAADRLLKLEHRGVFLVELEAGVWFRYHSLVGTLLRARLRQHDPQLSVALHQRAAKWYADQGLIAEAEDHARAAKDWILLGQLVVMRWLEATLDDVSLDLLADLSEDTVLDTPTLTLVAAAEACKRGDGIALAGYRRALEHTTPTLDSTVLGPRSWKRASAVLEVLEGCAFGANRRAKVSAAWLFETSIADIRLQRYAALRSAELELDACRTDLARAALESLTAADDLCTLVLQGWALRALIDAVDGRLTSALRLSAEVLAQPELPPDTIHLARLAAAVSHAQRGDATNVDITPGTSFTARPLREADSAIRAGVSGRGRFVTGLDAHTVEHPFATRALTALGVLEVVGIDRRLISVGGNAEAALRRARDAISAHAYTAVHEALEPWLGEDPGDTHPRTLIEASVQRAIACLAQADSERARLHLRAAMDLAAVDGLRAPLLAHGRELTELLQYEAAASDPYQSAALELLDRVQRLQNVSFVVPLTHRECVVLGLLPTMMSNEEIAQSMHVSVNTVKTHLKALYRKLSVDRRRDAVVRARQLELL
jgi:LuxR family maltose regulon positive regulatory protein